MISDVERVISRYKESTNYEHLETDLKNRTDREGNGAIRVVDSYLICNGDRSNVSLVGAPFKLVMVLKKNSTMYRNGKVEVAANICNEDELKILQFSTRFIDSPLTIEKDMTTLEFSIPKLPVTPGKYYVRYYIDDGMEVLDWVDHAFTFTIENGDFYGKGLIENSALLLTRFNMSID